MDYNNYPHPFDSLKELFEQLDQLAKNELLKQQTYTNKKDNSDINSSFENALKPGRIVKLEISGVCYLGIILSSKTIVYVSFDGQIKGYLNNYTMDKPYKIDCIIEPSPESFQLKDYKKMKYVWIRPQAKPVKKSVAEIEKELGLTPGTLEIC